MRILLDLFFYYCHAALATRVRASTPFSLMRHYVHAFYFDSTVDTRYLHIGADCLMLVDVLSDALGLTHCECLTFYCSVLAFQIM